MLFKNIDIDQAYANHVETTLCHDITRYDISWQPWIEFLLGLLTGYLAKSILGHVTSCAVGYFRVYLRTLVLVLLLRLPK